jgi:hypothetical protein
MQLGFFIIPNSSTFALSFEKQALTMKQFVGSYRMKTSIFQTSFMDHIARNPPAKHDRPYLCHLQMHGAWFLSQYVKTNILNTIGVNRVPNVN